MKTRSKTKEKNILKTVDMANGDDGTEMSVIKEKLQALGQIENQFKAQVRTFLGNWFDEAVVVGEYFNRRKENAGHGKYLLWLRDHFPINRRTASNYMLIFNQREPVKAAIEMGNVSHLKAAYTFAAKMARQVDGEGKIVDVKAETISPKSLLLTDKPSPINLAPGSQPGKKANKVIPKKIKIDQISPKVEPLVLASPVEAVLIFSGSDQFISKIVEATKHSGEKFEHQVIRGGEMKLAAHFAEKLGLKGY
jgi:hypothetical protein